jgi:hypothetical protein
MKLFSERWSPRRLPLREPRAAAGITLPDYTTVTLDKRRDTDADAQAGRCR